MAQELDNYPLKAITLECWRLLLDEKIGALPVDPFKIAERHGIKVLTYRSYCEAVGLTREELIAKYGQDGFTLSIDNQFLIFYDEFNNSSRIRWTVMHEFSHIFLGHFTNRADIDGDATGTGKSRCEAEADELTARVLSPMVILHLCCVSSVDELQKMTRLSREASLYRWKRLMHVRRTKKVIGHPLEMEVLLQFRNFVTDYIIAKVQHFNQLEHSE